MPFDPHLAERLKRSMPAANGLAESRMFGGFGYFLNGNMCCGVHREHYLFRLGVDGMEAQRLAAPQLRPMDLTGKPMKGWGMLAGSQCGDAELTGLVVAAVTFAGSLPAKTPRKA